MFQRNLNIFFEVLESNIGGAENDRYKNQRLNYRSGRKCIEKETNKRAKRGREKERKGNMLTTRKEKRKYWFIKAGRKETTRKEQKGKREKENRELKEKENMKKKMDGGRGKKPRHYIQKHRI